MRVVAFLAMQAGGEGSESVRVTVLLVRAGLFCYFSAGSFFFGGRGFFWAT